MALPRRTIKVRLLAAFGIMVLLSVILGLLSLLQLQNLSRLNDQLYNHPLMVSNAARDVMADVYAMHRSMKDVVLADNPREVEQAVALVNSFEQDALGRFQILQERYLGDPVDVTTALALFKAWRPIREEVVALALEGRSQEAEAVTKGKGAAHVATLYSAVRTLQDYAQHKAEEFYGNVLETRRRAQQHLVLLVVATAICGVLLALAITRSITMPLAEVVQAIRHIARGDPGHPIHVTGRDEMAQLADSFRAVQESIKQKVAIAHRIASGDYSNTIEPVSPDDSLGIAMHGMAAALKDRTTELTDANMQLAEKAAQLEQASKVKSQFLANMSHEVRTPLNGVMGMLQLLNTTNQSREQQEYSSVALESCKRLTNLLSDILDISRIEAGVLSIVEEPFSLSEVLDEVRGLFQVPAAVKGLALDLSWAPEVPDRLVGDPNRLRQVLFNLVGNAVKFTNLGNVAVHVSSLPERNPGEIRLLFSVSDTGTGIPDNLLQDVFQPFVQAEDTFRRNHQGAGLGLPICKRLVDLMGGAMAVDNQETGTIMHVSLPFKRMEPARTESIKVDSQAAAAAEAGHRILLVDDDQAGRLALAVILGRQGYVIQEAEHGRAALAALKDHDFDCVLMDVQMPELDGVEATRIIRCSPEFRDKASIPIIAVTAYAMAEDRTRCMAAGMDGFLPKPVEAESVVLMLDQVLSGKTPPPVNPC